MELALFLSSLLVVVLADIVLRIRYKKYRKIPNENNISGYEVAKKILEKNKIYDVDVREIGGTLTDNYNNRHKAVYLSSEIYNDSSVASLAVASHECGHVLQYKDGYLPIKLRNILVHFVNISNRIGYIVLFIGFFLQYRNLAFIGIILISFAVLFQLITLPCEFNASKRAKKELDELNLVNDKEKEEVSTMLYLAGFTYIAGLLSSVLEIYRLYRNIKRK